MKKLIILAISSMILAGCDEGREIDTTVFITNSTRHAIFVELIPQSRNWEKTDVMLPPCSIDNEVSLRFTVSRTVIGPNESSNVRILARLEKDGRTYVTRNYISRRMTRWGGNTVQITWNNFEGLTQQDACGFSNDQVETVQVNVTVSNAVALPVTQVLFLVPRLNNSGVIQDQTGIAACGEKTFPMLVDFPRYGNQPLNPRTSAQISLEVTVRDSTFSAKSRSIRLSVTPLGPNSVRVETFHFTKNMPKC